MSSKFFLLLIPIAVVSTQLSGPVVRIPHGLLQGTWKVSTNGRTFASFQGIPYARPPVGKYRFRAPKEMKPWSGVWDATRPLSNCLQYNPVEDGVTGSENCLFINVYTTNVQAGSSQRLPVLVFIHGGAFMYGGSSYYGVCHLMDRDLVVVTLNYRLGPLGFLSTGDDAAPGNAGLKDQAFALRWVQTNIMMFGGDPDRVTLMGNSAGSASVHYHYLSPLSEGTFARGIACSGSAFSSWTYATKPVEKAKSLAAIVGCPTTNNYDMVECLKYRPGEVVVRAQIEMYDWKLHWFTPFTPTAEDPSVKGAFLTQYPFHAAHKGGMHRRPLMVSVTSHEGLYPAAAYQSDPGLLPEIEEHWEYLASNIFEYNDTLPVERRKDVAAKIKQHYLGGKPVSQETFQQLVEALSDRLFVADVVRLAHIHADTTKEPVYFYNYAFRGEVSLTKLMAHNDVDYGASHADDVIIHMFEFPGLSYSSTEDAKMTEVLLNIIHSFASTGVPKATNDGPEWLMVTPGSTELKYLDIISPTKLEIKTASDFGQGSFWDSLGFNENQNFKSSNTKDEL